MVNIPIAMLSETQLFCILKYSFSEEPDYNINEITSHRHFSIMFELHPVHLRIL